MIIKEIKRDGFWAGEVRNIKKDGTAFWCSARVTTFTHSRYGTVWIALHHDITERKQVQEALQHHRTMLTQTEKIALIGSWEWDVATGTVTWSEEMFRIFQRDPAKGAPSFAEQEQLYHPEDIAQLKGAVVAVVNEGRRDYELELRAIRADGETRVCLAHGQAKMGADGKATRLFGSLQDITERKQAEAALRQKAEALRASNAELEQFNRAMVSRELRMIELKQEINELCRRLGAPPRYETDQFQTGRIPGAGPAPGGGGA